MGGEQVESMSTVLPAHVAFGTTNDLRSVSVGIGLLVGGMGRIKACARRDEMQRAQSKPRIAGNELVFMTDEEMKNEKAEAELQEE